MREKKVSGVKSEELYRLLFENSADAILLTYPDGRISAANPAACRMFGRTEAEFKRIGRAGTVDLKDPRIPAIIEERRRTGKFSGEIGHVRKDGSVFPGEITTNIFRGPDGVERMATVIRDITERKRAEEKLRESEAEYRSLFEDSILAISQATPDGHSIRANMTYAHMYGYSTPDQMIREVSDFGQFYVHPEERKDVLRIINEKGFMEPREFQLVRRDGTPFTALVSARAVKDPNGKLLYYQATHIDITELKRTEQARREAESLLRTVLNSAPITIFATDSQGKFTLSEGKGLEHAGLKPSENVGVSAVDLYDSMAFIKPSGQVITGRDIFRRVLAGETVIARNELRGVCFDNHIGPVCDADGKVVGMVGVAIDITERKQAESKREAALEALAQQNEALSKLNRFSIELSMLSSQDNLELFITKRIKEIAGAVAAIFSEYNPENRTTTARYIDMEPGLLGKVVGLLGKQVEKIRSLVSEETYREMTTEIVGMPRTLYEASFGAVSRPVGAAIEALLKVDRFIGIAYLIEGKLYGTSLLAMGKGQPDPSKQILENFSFLAALSLRRKRAESQREAALEALSESEEIFRQFMKNSPIYVFFKDEKFRAIRLSDNYEKMLGRPIDELLGKNLDELFPSELAKSMVADDMRILAENKQIVIEEELNGRFYTTFKFPITIEGKARYLAGFTMDITESKQAEENLGKSESNLRALAMELSRVEQSERQRLALFLHDEIGQSLALVQLKLGSLAGDSKSKSDKRQIKELRDLLETIIEQTHSLTFELSPPVLHQLGLAAAIEWAGEKVSRDHGLNFAFNDNGEAKSLNSDLQAILFRCIRELMLNTVKHAQAKNLTVAIAREGEEISFAIADDGCGFDPSLQDTRTEEAGFGLLSVREHLVMMGGACRIQSAPGQGTRITLTIPRGEGGGARRSMPNSGRVPHSRK